MPPVRCCQVQEGACGGGTMLPDSSLNTRSPESVHHINVWGKAAFLSFREGRDLKRNFLRGKRILALDEGPLLAEAV